MMEDVCKDTGSEFSKMNISSQYNREVTPPSEFNENSPIPSTPVNTYSILDNAMPTPPYDADSPSSFVQTSKSQRINRLHKNRLGKLQNSQSLAPESEFSDDPSENEPEKRNLAGARWTKKEDELVIYLREKQKFKWYEITDELNGRHTPQAVQMRYLRVLKKKKPLIMDQEKQTIMDIMNGNDMYRIKRYKNGILFILK